MSKPTQRDLFAAAVASTVLGSGGTVDDVCFLAESLATSACERWGHIVEVATTDGHGITVKEECSRCGAQVSA